jgi:Tfp pilus assembly protein PilX
MKPHQQLSSISANRKLKQQSGIILIATLVLLATLTLIGVTAFLASSSNTKIGGNYRTGQTALQIAMAGAEQARETLRAANATSSNPANFSEELLARVGVNGVLNGYTSSTDDTPIASSSTLISGYSYSAYLTNDPSEGASSSVPVGVAPEPQGDTLFQRGKLLFIPCFDQRSSRPKIQMVNRGLGPDIMDGMVTRRMNFGFDGEPQFLAGEPGYSDIGGSHVSAH